MIHYYINCSNNKKLHIRDLLYINDTPYIQRRSQGEYETAEDYSCRSPLYLTMLSVIHIQQTDLYEQQYSKHNVYNRENDIVGYGLYLSLRLIPSAFYSTCNVALCMSVHYCEIHKCHYCRKLTGEGSFDVFLQIIDLQSFRQVCL